MPKPGFLQLVLALPLAVGLLPRAARAVEATLTDDAFVGSGAPNANQGGANNLIVSGAGSGAIRRSYLRFDLSGLPAGTTAADVARATLVMFPGRVAAAGAVEIHAVSGPWSENQITYQNAPAFGGVLATATPAVSSFLVVDVTGLVQGWVRTPGSNQGVALVAAAANGSVSFDSKESPGRSARLDITLQSSGLVARVAALETRATALEIAVAAQATQIAALQGALATESAGRQAADTALSAALAAESTARQQDDAAGQTYAAALVTQETSARQAAEAGIAGLVASEASARQASDTALSSTVGPLAAKLAPVSLVGSELVVVGVNLHVVNGLGATESTNGLGNVIIGYGENSELAPRTGSHNLVVGVDHGYTSYGGLVAGHGNFIGGTYASVLGGSGNGATGPYATVSGGAQNLASANAATVGGGWSNQATQEGATVSGGYQNVASGVLGTIGGGHNVQFGVDESWTAQGTLTP